MASKGMVRIIAGKWRGKKLKVPEVKNLRPTPDRVRETVFNWLSPVIEGAYCLDLFTGSGALGFEALSRGAAHVTMVDQSALVVKSLQDELQQLSAKNAIIYRAHLPKQLRSTTHAFNIVFLDPPYQENVLLPSCFYLEAHGFLADLAYLYLEAHSVIQDNELPANWQVVKVKQAGQVVYHLVKRVKPA